MQDKDTFLSLRRSEFNPSAVRVQFVVDKVALRQVFLRVLRFSLTSIISSLLILIHSSSISDAVQSQYYRAVVFNLGYAYLRWVREDILGVRKIKKINILCHDKR